MRDSKLTGPASTSQLCPSLRGDVDLDVRIDPVDLRHAAFDLGHGVHLEYRGERVMRRRGGRERSAQTSAAPADTIRDEDCMLTPLSLPRAVANRFPWMRREGTAPIVPRNAALLRIGARHAASRTTLGRSQRALGLEPAPILAFAGGTALANSLSHGARS